MKQHEREKTGSVTYLKRDLNAFYAPRFFSLRISFKLAQNIFFLDIMKKFNPLVFFQRYRYIDQI